MYVLKSMHLCVKKNLMGDFKFQPVENIFHQRKQYYVMKQM